MWSSYSPPWTSWLLLPHGKAPATAHREGSKRHYTGYPPAPTTISMCPGTLVLWSLMVRPPGNIDSTRWRVGQNHKKQTVDKLCQSRAGPQDWHQSWNLESSLPCWHPNMDACPFKGSLCPTALIHGLGNFCCSYTQLCHPQKLSHVTGHRPG